MALSDEKKSYSKGFRWDLSDPKQNQMKNAEDSARSKYRKAVKRLKKASRLIAEADRNNLNYRNKNGNDFNDDKRRTVSRSPHPNERRWTESKNCCNDVKRRTVNQSQHQKECSWTPLRRSAHKNEDKSRPVNRSPPRNEQRNSKNYQKTDKEKEGNNNDKSKPIN